MNDLHLTPAYGAHGQAAADNAFRHFLVIPPERGRGIAGATFSCVNLFSVKGFAAVGTYHLNGGARSIFQRLIDPPRLIDQILLLKGLLL